MSTRCIQQLIVGVGQNLFSEYEPTIAPIDTDITFEFLNISPDHADVDSDKKNRKIEYIVSENDVTVRHLFLEKSRDIQNVQ